MSSGSGIPDVTAFFKTRGDAMPRMHQPGEAPNPVDIELFLDALYENAIAIPSSSTPLGHLALVVEATKFLALNNGDIWEEPRNPGTSPTAPTNVPTAQAAEQVFNPEIALFTAQERIRIYNESKSTYKTFLAAKTALRNQVLNAVDDKFISALKESIVGYTRLAPLDIISQHSTLFTCKITYGRHYLKKTLGTESGETSSRERER